MTDSHQAVPQVSGEEKTEKNHTVHKIGGTSMSDVKTVFDNILIGGRSGEDLYNRIFVVSAYGGITDMLLENKKTGEPGVYALYAGSENDWAWGDALSKVQSHMLEINADAFDDDSDRKLADRFVQERVEGVRNCLIDLQRICGYGHFKLEEHLMTVREMISGIGEGCRQAGCALIGGETAEMPGFYADNEYDLAGFAVGLVDNAKIIDGSEIRRGDSLVGIASSGLHSNGYSLVRKIVFDVLNMDVATHVPELGRTIGEELLVPTRIYATAIESLARDLPLRGLAHITGGGISENVVRVIPDSCGIRLFDGSWDVPPIFPFLQKAGRVADSEMKRTFNNGIGMIAVVPEQATADVVERLRGMDETVFVVGEVIKRPETGPRIEWVENDACRER